MLCNTSTWPSNCSPVPHRHCLLCEPSYHSCGCRCQQKLAAGSAQPSTVHSHTSSSSRVSQVNTQCNVMNHDAFNAMAELLYTLCIVSTLASQQLVVQTLMPHECWRTAGNRSDMIYVSHTAQSLLWQCGTGDYHITDTAQTYADLHFWNVQATSSNVCGDQDSVVRPLEPLSSTGGSVRQQQVARQS